MPHVYKHKTKKPVLRDLEKHIEKFLAATTNQTRKNIFGEIMTTTEQLMIAKRLAIIFLIANGKPTHTISHVLKVSPSTVARFERAVADEQFSHTANWLKTQSARKSIFEVLVSVAAVPFEAQHKSLNQLMKDL